MESSKKKSRMGGHDVPAPKQEHCDVVQVEIDVRVCLACNERTEMSSNNTVPSWLEAVIELSLQEPSHISLKFVLAEGTQCQFNCNALQIGRHVRALDNDLGS